MLARHSKRYDLCMSEPVDASLAAVSEKFQVAAHLPGNAWHLPYAYSTKGIMKIVPIGSSEQASLYFTGEVMVI